MLEFPKKLQWRKTQLFSLYVSNNMVSALFSILHVHFIYTCIVQFILKELPKYLNLSNVNQTAVSYKCFIDIKMCFTLNEIVL